MKKRESFKEKFDSIFQDWFLTEPVLFSVLCTHEVVGNKDLPIPFRTGKKKIEYNPEITKNLSREEVSEYLKIEIYRILLGHPYQRQPVGSKKPYLTVSSDAVIHANYMTDIKLNGVKFMEEMIMRLTLLADGLPQNRAKMSKDNISEYKKHILTKSDLTAEEINNKKLADGTPIYFIKGDDADTEYVLSHKHLLQKSSVNLFWIRKVGHDKHGHIVLPKELCFEEWYTKILALMQATDNDCLEKSENEQSDSELDNLSTQSSLWEENIETQQIISDIIENAKKSEQWGSISDDIKDLISANKTVSINYAELLRHFCTSLISSRRNLTRMKPNRRFGFSRLGSRYALAANLLVAVDVSSSISKENLSYFFSVINHFFRYGIEKIDTVHFTDRLLGTPVEMNKSLSTIKISERGGTDFQCVADFFCEQMDYDGLIFFTDGFAPAPKFKECGRRKVLWIFTNRTNYERAQIWVKNLEGNYSTFIPLP